MKSVVDPDLCISCELCTNLCPDVYSMGDDGLAHAITGDIAGAQENDAQNAADSCPTSAISID
ncbi:MAG: ferredoxin [Anaerocolumna sp.]